MLYNALTSRLRNQHEAIIEIIAPADDTRLYENPAPGKWSAFDNIVHLAKYQPVFIDRINTMLQANETVFERYSAEDDPEFSAWQQWPLDKLLERLQEDRLRIFSLVSNLTEEELEHAGIHKKYGRLTIIQWTEFFLLHEAHHIFTIFRILNDIEAVKR